MQELSTAFNILILIMSVVLHEVSHGYAALYFGDQTALRQGRLTLNPLKHLDMVGSVIIPIVLVLSHAPFPFGWAKPVPYNPNNLRNFRVGTIAVAVAGVAANFLIAIVFGLVIRLALGLGFTNVPFLSITSIIVLINIGLGVFNLIPIAPLDGSKIIFALLPPRLRYVENFFERYAIIIVIAFILILWKFDIISPVVISLFTFLTGIH